MQEYYVEYQFKTQDFKKEFLFPIFILAKNEDSATLMSHKVSKELGNQFILKSVSSPKLGYSQFTQNYYHEKYGLHVDRNKVVQLNVITYKFNDFTPSTVLTFNENLEKFLEEKYFETDVAKSISNENFPVRVLKDQTGLQEFDDYLLININI